MLTTDQKGNIAELAVAYAAAKLGLVVFRPVGEGSRYDLIFDLGGRLLRVQCKWARRRGGVLVVNCESSRRTAGGYRRRKYTALEIDGIAAYSPDLERCYFLPVGLVAAHRELSLRLDPAKNNQLMGLNWANPFDFSAIDWSADSQLGAIAQLEERGHGMAEVVGSSPTSSIPEDSSELRLRTVSAEDARNRLATHVAGLRPGDELLITRRGKPYARLLPP